MCVCEFVEGLAGLCLVFYVWNLYFIFITTVVGCGLSFWILPSILCCSDLRLETLQGLCAVGMLSVSLKNSRSFSIWKSRQHQLAL